MPGKHQGADEERSRVSGVRWSRNLLAVDAEMLFDGRDALEGIIDLLAIAGHSGRPIRLLAVTRSHRL